MKTLNIDALLVKLSDSGVIRCTTSEYKAIMVSDSVNDNGEFWKIYKAHALQFKVSSKRIAPGVYSVSLVDFDKKLSEIKCQ